MRLAPVQPAPVPPKRDLVALPPLPKVALHAEGRFTVLSYNILADLYATVGLFSRLCSAAAACVYVVSGRLSVGMVQVDVSLATAAVGCYAVRLTLPWSHVTII